MSSGKRLRQVTEDSTIQIPGASNALVARLVERSGFEAMYLSGAALSASVLALPDVGLFTLTELTQQTKYLTAAVEIPLIVDADTGFGEAIQVERTIGELEAAGAAAIQLEDQKLPKRCGHLSGKTIVSCEDMCAKIMSASRARADASTVIIARTDAIGVDGLDAAITRADRYLDAGADWIFPEALGNYDEFARFAESVDAPLIANMTEFGKSPLLTGEELAALGFTGIIYPATLLRVAMKATEAALALLAEEGTQAGLLEVMQTREELYDLLDYTDFEQRDKEYFGGMRSGDK